MNASRYLRFPTRGFLLAVCLAAVLSASLAACGGDGKLSPNPDATPTLKVVTTMAILADIVRNVGGARVEVRSIVPSGADVHSFQPTPGDSVAIADAKLIVSNGMGLDAFLEPLIDGAKGEGALHISVAEGLDAMPVEPVTVSDGAPGSQDVDRDRSVSGDPHLWQNPLYAVHYVERIRDALIRADPAGADGYLGRASTYIGELVALDGEIAATLKAVPVGRRRLVSFHDSFGHFGERYGWEVSAFVPHDASDVTPGWVSYVLERVREEGIPVVFAEPQFSPGVLAQAARDSGVAVGVIYSDSLDDDVPTYIAMMKFNAESLLRLAASREEVSVQ